MNPIKFPQVNEIHGPPEGMTEDECIDLPVCHGHTPDLHEAFISCWELTEEELQIIIKTRKVWVWQFGNFVQPISIDAVNPFEPENSRTANLHPDYVYKHVPEHGTGMYSVNKHTGKVCDCKMIWNEEGTILSCPVCGLDGT